MGSALTPWLTKALQLVGVAAAQEVLQYLYTEITTQEGDPVNDYANFVKQQVFLSAALSEYGLGGMAVLHDEGVISAGELFYCTILSWSVTSSSLPISILDDLEAFGLENLASVSFSAVANVTKNQDAAKLTNNLPALSQAMSYLLAFGRAQALDSLVPVVR